MPVRYFTIINSMYIKDNDLFSVRIGSSIDDSTSVLAISSMVRPLGRACNHVAHINSNHMHTPRCSTK